MAPPVFNQFKYPISLSGKECHLLIPPEYLDKLIDFMVLKLTKLDKEKTALNTKLSKPGFQENAPALVVEDMRNNYAKACQQNDALMESLDEALGLRYPPSDAVTDWIIWNAAPNELIYLDR